MNFPNIFTFIMSWKTTLGAILAVLTVIYSCMNESRLPHSEEWAILFAAIGLSNAKDFNITGGTKVIK
jgi:hypothetical protein